MIGAVALAAHGRPRFSEDLDLLVEPRPANAVRLGDALRAFGYPGLADAAPEHFAVVERMARIGMRPLAIDILTNTTGVTFDEVWRNRKRLRFGRLRFAVIGRRELIKTKRACDRPKDRADLALLDED